MNITKNNKYKNKKKIVGGNYVEVSVIAILLTIILLLGSSVYKNYDYIMKTIGNLISRSNEAEEASRIEKIKQDKQVEFSKQKLEDEIKKSMEEIKSIGEEIKSTGQEIQPKEKKVGDLFEITKFLWDKFNNEKNEKDLLIKPIVFPYIIFENITLRISENTDSTLNLNSIKYDSNGLIPQMNDFDIKEVEAKSDTILLESLIANAIIYRKVMIKLETSKEEIAKTVVETIDGMKKKYNSKENILQELIEIFKKISNNISIASLYLMNYEDFYKMLVIDNILDPDTLIAYKITQLLFNYDIKEMKSVYEGKEESYKRAFNYILYYFFKNGDEIIVNEYKFVICRNIKIGENKSQFGCLLIAKNNQTSAAPPPRAPQQPQSQPQSQPQPQPQPQPPGEPPGTPSEEPPGTSPRTTQAPPIGIFPVFGQSRSIESDKLSNLLNNQELFKKKDDYYILDDKGYYIEKENILKDLKDLPDPYKALGALVIQQRRTFRQILKELEFKGKKEEHWAWWVFPTEQPGQSEGATHLIDDIESRVTKDTAQLLLTHAPAIWEDILEKICNLVEEDITKIPKIDYDRIKFFVEFWQVNTPRGHWLEDILSRLKKSELYRSQG